MWYLRKLVQKREKMTKGSILDIIDDRISVFRKWCDKSGLQQKEHQLSGMKFCLGHEFKKSVFGVHGGIVADEMGLGKTILMLGCILTNYGFVDFYKQKCRNTLIVVPKALLFQWVDVINRLFNEKVKINIFHGVNCKDVTRDELETGAITITTYGMVSRDAIQNTFWKRVIFDEAHHLRNSKSKKHTGSILIKAKIKWLLSGTPINNRVKDLESLCKILLGAKRSCVYKNEYEEVVSEHILKRTKKGVGIKLPPVNTSIIKVDWKCPDEKRLAIQIHKKINFSNIKYNIAAGDIIRDMTKNQLGCFIRGRQVCILSTPIIKTMKIKMKLRDEMTRQDDVVVGQDDVVVGQDDVVCRGNVSSKLDAVISHIMKDLTRKKLIFCHYLDEIDYLYKYFNNNGIDIGKITGKTTEKERRDLFSQHIGFNDFCALSKTHNKLNADIFKIVSDFTSPRILIVQIQTGCEGLNLQHFKDIYFTSPHWNPSVEDQAVARSHRIGQTSVVNVYKFMMDDLYKKDVGSVDDKDDDGVGNTMDKYCLHVQNKKRELMEYLDKYETDKAGSYLLC